MDTCFIAPLYWQDPELFTKNARTGSIGQSYMLVKYHLLLCTINTLY